MKTPHTVYLATNKELLAQLQTQKTINTVLTFIIGALIVLSAYIATKAHLEERRADHWEMEACLNDEAAEHYKAKANLPSFRTK